MNNRMQNEISKDAGSEAEKTLRLLARVTPPEGLEDRMMAGVRRAPRRAAVLAWPRTGVSGWMRSAAAAAIVFVVAGGGWSVYSHVQPRPLTGGLRSAIVVSPGSFRTGGDVKVPTTLNRPTVAEPVVAKPAEPKPAEPKPSGQASSQLSAGKSHRATAALHKKTATAPAQR